MKFVLFVGLLLIIIFIEGIVIIDQEIRIKAMKTKVDEVAETVEATLERAETLINTFGPAPTFPVATSTDATSTDE